MDKKIYYLAHYSDKLVFVGGKDVAEILTILNKNGFGEPIKLDMNSIVFCGSHPPVRKSEFIYGTVNKIKQTYSDGNGGFKHVSKYVYVSDCRDKKSAVNALKAYLNVELTDMDVAFFGKYYDLYVPDEIQGVDVPHKTVKVGTDCQPRPAKKFETKVKKRLIVVSNDFLDAYKCPVETIVETKSGAKSRSSVLSILKGPGDSSISDPNRRIAPIGVDGNTKNGYFEPNRVDGLNAGIGVKNFLVSQEYSCCICSERCIYEIWGILSNKEKINAMLSVTVAKHHPVISFEDRLFYKDVEFYFPKLEKLHQSDWNTLANDLGFTE